MTLNESSVSSTNRFCDVQLDRDRHVVLEQPRDSVVVLARDRRSAPPSTVPRVATLARSWTKMAP